ncbi:MAG: hypothetical protein EZS28_052066, partial [Streblomastix strix]
KNLFCVSNRNRKTAGGDSHPTTRNDRAQIVDAARVLTGEGKLRVATG